MKGPRSTPSGHQRPGPDRARAVHARGLGAWIWITSAGAGCGAVGCADRAAQPEPKPATAEEVQPAAPETTRAAARHGLSAEQAAQPLFKLGAEVFTVGDFADRLAEQSPYLRARYQSVERRRELLENIIRFELLAQEAQRLGYMDRPEVKQVEEQVMVQALMEELFASDEIVPEAIEPAEIQAFYREHPEEFHKPSQVRASHILLADQARAQHVLEQLQQAQPQEKMARFRTLAERFNTDTATAGSAGDLHFFGQDPAADAESAPTLPAEVRAAALSLEALGDLYPEPVRSEAGYHVVILTGRRDALQRSLQDAERMIRNRLWREKRQQAIDAFVAKLRKNARVEEDLSLLSNVAPKIREE